MTPAQLAVERDRLLEGGRSPEVVAFMQEAARRMAWLEADEDDNERYWKTISIETAGVRAGLVTPVTPYGFGCVALAIP